MVDAGIPDGTGVANGVMMDPDVAIDDGEGIEGLEVTWLSTGNARITGTGVGSVRVSVSDCITGIALRTSGSLMESPGENWASAGTVAPVATKMDLSASRKLPITVPLVIPPEASW